MTGTRTFLQSRGVAGLLSAFMMLAFILPAQATELSDEGAKQMIDDLGLVEASTPIRESPGWRKPEQVLVWRLPADARKAFESAAPGVKIISAQERDDYIKLAPHADAVLGPCVPAMLEAGKRVRWLQTFTAGMENCVSQEPIRSGRVMLTNMQRIGSPVMADHVMAMLLTLSRNLPAYRDAQREGKWRGDDAVAGSFGLSGKTLCIAGLGGTGLEVAKRAHAFGMKIVGTRNSGRDAPGFVSYVGLADELPMLVASADVVVNTLPLTSATRNLFDARLFGAMKNGTWFFNVGRGQTVVTADLVQALRSGKLAGAGLDVVDPEPLPADSPLWKMPNVIITPHVSSDATEFGYLRWQMARENLRRYVAGEKMLSLVDPQRGY